MCRLAGLGFGPCKGREHRHHIIAVGKARGSKAVSRVLKSYPPELIALVCEAHNVGRAADSTRARRALVKQNTALYGEPRMRQAIDGLPWKVQPHELTFDGIMGSGK